MDNRRAFNVNVGSFFDGPSPDLIPQNVVHKHRSQVYYTVVYPLSTTTLEDTSTLQSLAFFPFSYLFR